MTAFDLKTERDRVRTEDGAVSKPLHDELRRVVVTVSRRLPPAMSPYGTWDDEGVNDVLGGWFEGKLLREGQLFALLDRARTRGAFRKLAERSLYHWLLSERERSQRQNVYDRLVEALKSEGGPFVLVKDSKVKQHRVYSLIDDRHDEPFGGGDRLVAAAAWAQGELALLHYASGDRLSPLLRTSQLADFAAGVMQTLGAALSVEQLMMALGTRLDLSNTTMVRGDALLAIADERAAPDALILAEAVDFVLGRLTARQSEILVGTDEGEQGSDMARRLGCSAGTITNEQRRIAALIDQFAEGDDERSAILRLVIDRLYTA